ncbi:MAG TPA: diaminopimelate decarboxylase [Dehalococcoidia bacterium]
MTQELTEIDAALRPILPVTAAVSPQGHLVLGGCDVVDLAREYGTPLYVFDEETLRGQCRAFRAAFGEAFPQAFVRYGAKAYINRTIAAVVREEGLGLDVVSGGELAVALAAGFPADRIDFHGNNKLPQELREALTAGVGHVIIDNFYELALLERVAGEVGRRQPVLIRVSPGIDPHTHAKTTTGTVDSKFGIPIATGQAAEAVARVLASEALELRGLHFHLGSPIFETEPYAEAVEVVMAFAAAVRERHGWTLPLLNAGGGMAVQYVRERPAPEPAAYARTLAAALRQASERHGLPLPAVAVEPGRAIVARAGVALYTVGSGKEVPGVRTFVSVDGGMADNIRPAMYGARYEALLAGRRATGPTARVTIAGRYCESGDLLVQDADLPRLEPGDLIAVPASGAYNLAMASNYNLALRPAVVLVKDGRARLMVRRETYDDLLRTDLFPG